MLGKIIFIINIITIITITIINNFRINKNSQSFFSLIYIYILLDKLADTLFYQFLILNQYLSLEYKCNDFFYLGTILLLNVVRFFFLNIFNLANIYLSFLIGLAANFNFKSPLTTFHISLYFS